MVRSELSVWTGIAGAQLNEDGIVMFDYPDPARFADTLLVSEVILTPPPSE